MDLFWLEQHERDLPRGDEWLSAGERARIKGLRIPKRRDDWRLGRWTAKRAVARYLNFGGTPDEVEVRPAASGAPQVFLYDEPAPLVISLSHSSGTGFCVVGPPGVEVGCDVERVESRCPAFLADYFTREEQWFAAQAPAAARDQIVTLLWSAKESTLKALQCGLRTDTRSLTVAPDVWPAASGEAWGRVVVAQRGGMQFCGRWRQAGDFIFTVVWAGKAQWALSKMRDTGTLAAGV